jgi:hypothetical protein
MLLSENTIPSLSIREAPAIPSNIFLKHEPQKLQGNVRATVRRKEADGHHPKT